MALRRKTGKKKPEKTKEEIEEEVGVVTRTGGLYENDTDTDNDVELRIIPCFSQYLECGSQGWLTHNSTSLICHAHICFSC